MNKYFRAGTSILAGLAMALLMPSLQANAQPTIDANAQSTNATQSVDSVGGDCSADIQSQAVPLFWDKYRVYASCSRLDVGTKARGVADYTADTDTYTAWFVQLNVTYYGPWDTSVAAPSARPEYAPL